MNAVHLHLVINHLPIVGTYLALPLLLWALIRRDRRALGAPVFLLLVGALGAVVAQISGEDAEETVERLPGVDEAAIAVHEERAEVSLVLSLVTAGVGAGAWLLARRGSGPMPAWIPAAPLVAAGATSVSLALTGLAGGAIRHPEIQGPSVVAAGEAAIPAGEAGERGEEEAD